MSQIWDSLVKHLPVGYGSSRRARGVRCGTLAARSDDSADLGRHSAPPDARRPGSDGARAPDAVRAPGALCHTDLRSLMSDLRCRIEQHLQLPSEEKEARIENVFRDLATFTARTLARRYAS